MRALDQAVEMPPPYEKLFSLTSLLWEPFHIFTGFLKTYLIRLIMTWSKAIEDKDVLSKLYSMIFSKFAHMQSHSFKIIASSVSEEAIVSSTTRSSYTIVQENTTHELKAHIRSLKKYGMENEAKQLLDFLEGINASEAVRQYFYAQNKPYRWDLKYKDNEMESLFEDMETHRDYIYDGLYDDYMESREE
jgi:hypothetical protein